jgi:PAS domain S-box-containing protein
MRWALEGRSTRFLALAIVILIISTLFLFLALVQFQSQNQRVRHTLAVLDQNERVLSLIKDAETGQRGYLLTGDRKYLKRYETATKVLHTEVEQLRQLVHNADRQPERVTQLAALLAAKQAEMAETIALRQTQGLEAAIAVVKTDRGKQWMDQIRQLAQAIHQEEQQRLQQDTQQSELAMRTMTFVLLGCSLLTFMLLSLASWLLSVDKTKRQQVEQALRQAKAELEQRVEARTAELHQTNLELRDSEAKFRQLAENILEVFWMMDCESFRAIYVSPTYEKLWGRSPDRLAENFAGWLEGVHPADRAQVEQVFSQICAGTYDAEYRIILPDHTMRWVRDRAFPIRSSSGQVLRVAGLTEDITDRKLAQESLQAYASKVKDLYNNAPCGYHSLDAEGVFVQINDTELKWLGYTRDQVLGKLKFLDIITPQSRQQLEVCFPHFQQQGWITDLEFEIIRADGTILPILLSATAVKDANGNYVMSRSTLFDLTERKRAEAQLAESEQNFRSIFEQAAIGLTYVNLDGTFYLANQKFGQIVGYSLAELQTMTFMQITHPEDLEADLALTRQLMAGTIPMFAMEKRFICKDGTPVWVNLTVAKQADAAGNPTRLVAAIEAIDDRKQTELALKQSEERLQLALEGSGDGLWDWNLDTDELYLSPRWLQMLGYEREDLPGNARVWEQLIHPDDRLWVMNLLTAHLQDSTVHCAFDYRLRTKSGNWKWIANYGKVVVRDRNGRAVRMSGTHRDITRQKQVEANLREAERRWRSLLEHIHLVVVGLDSRGTINFVNSFFLELVGYTEAEVLGQNWFTLFLLRTQQQTTQTCFWELQTQELHQYYENSILTKSGEERLIAWNNTVLRNIQGEPIGTMSIGEDITERQAIEKMQNEFISVVSHELRTPLASIRGALGLLAAGVLKDKPATAQQMLDIASIDTERLVRLVNDILDLERFEAGKVILHREWCEAATLVQQAIKTLQPLAEEHGITLVCQPIATQIFADRDRIIQTLVNLLGNAIKFSEPNSTVWLSAEGLEAGSQGVPPTVRFAVKDQGRGIPADQVEKIFGRFQQVDASDSRQKGGTGLGLAICRNIVQQHGGKIWAESVLGEGSVFYFTLPLLEPVADADRPPAKS